MYVVMIAALMIVFPLLSIAIQVVLQHLMLEPTTALRWFVFWTVGIRLLVAGLRQMIQPRYTAESILGIKHPDATLVVRELGFANAAIGSIATSTIIFSTWVFPMAMVGGIFYVLAGINHLADKKRNHLQSVAMTSDLFAALVLLGLCLTIVVAEEAENPIK